MEIKEIKATEDYRVYQVGMAVIGNNTQFLITDSLGVIMNFVYLLEGKIIWNGIIPKKRFKKEMERILKSEV